MTTLPLLLPDEADTFDRLGWSGVLDRRASQLTFDGPDSPWIAAMIGGGNRDALDRPFTKNAWVYACVHAICLNLSTLPIRIYTGTRAKPQLVERGPMVDLWEQPQERTPREDSIYRFALWLLLRGETFAIPLLKGVPLTAPKLPNEFAIVPPLMMKDVVERGRLVRWEVAADGGTNPLKLAPELVIHPLYPHPYNAFRGHSPTEVAFTDADAIYQAKLFNASFLKNGANPGGVYSYPKSLGTPQKKQISDAIDDKHAGPGRSGKTLVLDGGAEFKFNPSTAKDMQFLEGIRDARDTICAVFGVPKSVVSITDAINYATKLSEDRCFWERAVLPVGNRLASYFNAWFKFAGEKEWIAFDSSGVEALQDQLDDKIKVGEGLARLGWTADEINARLGLKMPTGKRWRGVSWIDPNKVSAESVLQSADDEAAAAATGAGPVQDTAMNGAQVAAMQAALKDVGAGLLAPEAAKGLILAAFPTLDATKISAMVDAQSQLAKEEPKPEPAAVAPPKPAMPPAPDAEVPVPRVLRSFGIRVVPARSELRAAAQGFRGKVVLPQERRFLRLGVDFLRGCRKEALAAFDSRAFTTADLDAIDALRGKWDARIKEIYADPMKAVVREAAKGTAAELGATFELDFNDPRWLRVQRDRLDKLVGVNETTLTRARSALVSTLAEGGSTSDLRKALEGVFDGDKARALNIARTEVGTLASSARDESFGELGIEYSEWLSANDDVVRDSHRIDGEIAARGVVFSNGLQYPHDPTADASEICSCRCDHVAVIK